MYLLVNVTKRFVVCEDISSYSLEKFLRDWKEGYQNENDNDYNFIDNCTIFKGCRAGDELIIVKKSF